MGSSPACGAYPRIVKQMFCASQRGKIISTVSGEPAGDERCHTNDKEVGSALRKREARVEASAKRKRARKERANGKEV